MGRQREGAQGTSVGWDSVPCHRVASRARDNGFPSKTGNKATKKKGSLKRGGWMPQPVRNFQPHRGILPCSQSPEKTGSLERAEGADMQTKPNQFLLNEGALVGGEACVGTPRRLPEVCVSIRDASDKSTTVPCSRLVLGRGLLVQGGLDV